MQRPHTNSSVRCLIGAHAPATAKKHTQIKKNQIAENVSKSNEMRETNLERHEEALADEVVPVLAAARGGGLRAGKGAGGGAAGGACVVSREETT